MAAFQPYAGVFTEDGETFRWNCYATCPVYEVRTFACSLPEPADGRKWVRKSQNGGSGPEVVVLVDGATTDFSQMLTQITAASAPALAF